MPPDPPPKKDQLHKLLARGSVFVHLDPRRDGVKVPEWLAGRPQLVLQLGLNFAIPIPDLIIDERGVRCTLSFNRSPFYCVLPWSAVYALVAEDGQVTVWPKEVPPELVPASAPVRRAPPASRSERSKPARPRISVVPSPAPETAPEAPPEPVAPAPAAAKGEKKGAVVRPIRPPKPEPVPAPAAEPAPEPTPEPEAPRGKKGKPLPSYLRVVK